MACGKFGYDVGDLSERSSSTAGAGGSRGAGTGSGGAGLGGAFVGGAGGVVRDASAFAGADAGGRDGTGGAAMDSGMPDGAGGSSGTTCPSMIVTSGQYATPLYGGSGGTPFTDMCPVGEAVIGYAGYTTTTSPIVVAWLQTICGKLSISSALMSCQLVITPGTILPGRGRAAGMGPWNAMCPANQVVVAFHGRAGVDLDQVAFECAPLTMSGSSGSYRLSIGAATSLPPHGGTTGFTYQDGCPAGQIVVGTDGQAGPIVYELGLSCGAPAIQP
jgi:hypothetical protein